jgi:predicted ATPase/class 3 adenylate cyclase
MNNSLPTGTVTFLFTDIEGSTKLAQEYPETWESLREQHNTILRRPIEAQQGYVFRIIGDAFCAAFHTVGDALHAALQAQRGLQAKAWEGPPIRVRMGIHTGQAEVQPDGEYLGYLTLTRVQRVMSAAHGGQVLLSNAAAELARAGLPDQSALRDMGEQRLKGLGAAERLWQITAPDLPENFPPLPTLSARPHNLPVQLTSFIGRVNELHAIKQELSKHRLVTLTGPGGIGKTRLSIQTAFDLIGDFRQGAWFVPLEHARDPALVPAAIAHVLHLQELPGSTIPETLKNYVREKELLLVLDNFEQVVEGAPFVKELLLAAPGLKAIVTSRTPLRIAGEYEYRVPLLSLPGEEKDLLPDRLAELESVQLFVERARAAKTGFTLTAENAPAIAETCRRLDGLPLAIELAAARVRLLPPQKMLDQLDDRLTFLRSSARDLPARQQTMRAAIDWSFDLLTPPEKLLFQRLAVFIGGATFEAIESVCAVDRELDLLSSLESLLEKSLIQQTEDNGEARYDMLETIRAYADQALIVSGDADLIQRRHLAYFQTVAHLAEPHLVGPQELTWITRLTRDHTNLQAAIQWGLQHDLERAVELLCDLSLFWSRGGHNEEAIGWLKRALSVPSRTGIEPGATLESKVRARALLTLGILSLQQDYPDALAILQESIALLREVGDRINLAQALAFVGFLGDLGAAEESVAIARSTNSRWILAYCLAWQSQALRIAGGDLQLAQTAAAESTARARQIGTDWGVARSLLSQGQLAIVSGQLDQARSFLKESAALFSRSLDSYHANHARLGLAHLERQQGNYDAALKLYQAALRVWQDWGLRAAIARELESIALLAAGLGASEHAVRLAGAAKRLREETGTQPTLEEQIELEESLAFTRRNLPDARYIFLLAEGQGMTLPESITYALDLPAQDSL